VQAESSGAPANECAPREVAQPECESGSGERDDPRRTAFERRVDGDEPQTDGEGGEQEPEKPPLHAPSVSLATSVRGSGRCFKDCRDREPAHRFAICG
jgi:hypothetical protein